MFCTVKTFHKSRGMSLSLLQPAAIDRQQSAKTLHLPGEDIIRAICLPRAVARCCKAYTRAFCRQSQPARLAAMHDGDRASRRHRDRHALLPLPGKPLFALQEALHGGPITPGVEADHFDYSKIGLEHCHFEFLQCIAQIHRRNSAILQLEIPLSTPLSTQFLQIHLTRIAPPGSPSIVSGRRRAHSTRFSAQARTSTHRQPAHSISLTCF